MESIAIRLKKELDKKGINAAHLGEAVSISNSTISRILNGTQYPNSDTLYKISKYLDVSMEYILTGEDTSQKNCVDAKMDYKENYLLSSFKKLSPQDQDELIAILNIKLAKSDTSKGEKLLTSQNTKTNTETA